MHTSRILAGSNIVLGPYGNDAGITAAEYVKSSVNRDQCPADGFPEFALVGRSNVGKSSLLNSIVRRKKLALTSKKPGFIFSTFFSLLFLKLGVLKKINLFELQSRVHPRSSQIDSAISIFINFKWLKYLLPSVFSNLTFY